MMTLEDLIAELEGKWHLTKEAELLVLKIIKLSYDKQKNSLKKI